eukprot:TRINITY_DN14100_c0_g1_i1.p1 TRINITY_DN14100_c0_g1~~TRINITY_DN14100_c0_g1_i1.p1  ORF type:complete len:611 (-),score=83.08 TRINITY_DN14100_c0_g1_i1:2-1834(-)
MPQPRGWNDAAANRSYDSPPTSLSEGIPSLTHPVGWEDTLNAPQAQERFFRRLCEHHLLLERRLRGMLSMQERRIVKSVVNALGSEPSALRPSTTLTTDVTSGLRVKENGCGVANRNLDRLSETTFVDASLANSEHLSAVVRKPGEHDVDVMTSLRRAQSPPTDGAQEVCEGKAPNPPTKLRISQSGTASSAETPLVPNRSLGKIVRGRIFEMSAQLMIVLCAVNIGFQGHWALLHIGEKPPASFETIDLVLSSIFTTELVARVLAEGSSFLHHRTPDFYWNLCDSVVVTISWFGLLFQAGASTVGIMRTIRMARMIRLIRICRVMRGFSALRVIVLGVMNSSRMMLWALFLLSLIMFIFGTTIMHLLEEHFVELMRPNEQFGDTMSRLKATDPSTEENVRFLLSSFGSLQATIMTLWLSATSGFDWGETFFALFQRSKLCGVVFMMWMAFAILCVLNIITGVFVESASKLTLMDKDVAYVEDFESRKRWAAEARELFNEIDTDHSDTIDVQEFVTASKDLRVQALFRKVGVDVGAYNARGLFALFDFHNDGILEADVFFEGLQQLHGTAKSIDMVHMKLESRKVQQQVQSLRDLVREKLFDGESTARSP